MRIAVFFFSFFLFLGIIKIEKSDKMEWIENLSQEEFEAFAKKHPQASFYQTIYWGKLKMENGWKMHLVGVKEKEK